MKLRKLILQGFKSFADKTEFEFQDGITAIVGPNGCGKSNVVDAVKWVLGEQRPSSLRGKEMQDVIFSGTDNRKGVGFAEVALVLDNADHTLPIDFEEVKVTRRLYRSGESEYLINGNPVRLRDVRELMMDSGGGPGALTVMEQGNIDRLLRSDPMDRRTVFEEAAGISKYRARRVETERKLEKTSENLARLRDILAEYETRQRSLKIQAGKARRWQEFSEELKRKRVQGALARFAELARRRDEARRDLDAIGTRESEARAALEEALRSSESRRADQEGLRERLNAREAEMASLAGEARAAEEREGALAREAGELEGRAQRAAREGAEARERAATLGKDLETARAEIDSAGAERTAREEARTALEGELRAAEARLAALEEEREALDLKRTSAFAAETAARNREVNAEAELRALRGRLQRLEEKSRNGGESLRALEETRNAARVRVRSAEEGVRSLEERAAAAEAALREARAAVEAAQSEEARLKEETAGLLARRDVLRSLVERGEGLTAGTKALLDAGRQGVLPGVRGLLADLVGDAGDLADPLDLALGELQGAVVVESTAAALGAIAWLKERKRGRARIVALDRLAPGGSLPPPLDGAKLDPAARDLVAALLRGTRIAPDLGAALGIGEGALFRIVSLEGEEIGPEGAIVAGTGDAGAGLVRRNAELAAIEKRLRRAESLRASAQAKCAEAREGALSWEGTLRDLQAPLRTAREELRVSGGALVAAERESEARAQEAEEERREREEIGRLVAASEAQCVSGRASREEAEASRLRMEEEARALQERLTRLSREREEALGRLSEARVEAARALERAEAARRRLRSLEESIAAASQEAGRRAEEAAQCDARRGRCLDEVASLAALSKERAKAMERLAAEVLEARRSVQETQARLQEGERLVRELREAHDRHRAELEEHRMRENECRLRIEALLEEIRRDHGLEVGPQELEAAGTQDREALEREIADLRDRLEKLGNVNHAALEELAEVEQKLDFMRKEEADLVTADQQLREAIVEIDQTCVQRFTETFEQIRDHFKEVFRKLFGGGKAEIFLENPDDVLTSGVEIRVRPPGKELRNLALLSGGEKSLTTVALLFAIYQTKPPPFCLLDEVDAALDEANTVRMCEMLKEYATRGQFLVITHSRPTMTAADALYGVTMPEAGVSRRVQVRFADIEAGRVVGLN